MIELPTGMIVIRANWDDMMKEITTEISEDTVRKAVIVSNGSTIIVDPDLEMVVAEQTWPDLAAKLSLQVLTIEAMPGVLAGFFYFDPDYRRGFQIFKGKIQIDHGEPLDEEKGIVNRFDMNRLQSGFLGRLMKNATVLTRLEEGDLVRLMQKFGISYGDLKSAGPFEVWELDSSALPTVDDEDD